MIFFPFFSLFPRQGEGTHLEQNQGAHKIKEAGYPNNRSAEDQKLRKVSSGYCLNEVISKHYEK